MSSDFNLIFFGLLIFSSSIVIVEAVCVLIIGLTLVSIGSSLPELSVCLTSSLNGFNDMSFGNVVGSNIFNVLVVNRCFSRGLELLLLDLNCAIRRY